VAAPKGNNDAALRRNRSIRQALPKCVALALAFASTCWQSQPRLCFDDASAVLWEILAVIETVPPQTMRLRRRCRKGVHRNERTCRVCESSHRAMVYAIQASLCPNLQAVAELIGRKAGGVDAESEFALAGKPPVDRTDSVVPLRHKVRGFRVGHNPQNPCRRVSPKGAARHLSSIRYARPEHVPSQRPRELPMSAAPGLPDSTTHSVAPPASPSGRGRAASHARSRCLTHRAARESSQPAPRSATTGASRCKPLFHGSASGYRSAPTSTSPGTYPGHRLCLAWCG
jgi:hypothetical protein